MAEGKRLARLHADTLCWGDALQQLPEPLLWITMSLCCNKAAHLPPALPTAS